MPYAAPKACRSRHCPNTVKSYGYCDQCSGYQVKRVRRQTHSVNGYGRSWASYRKVFLSDAANALCSNCPPTSRKPSSEVDHIIPIDGKDDPLFWDATNHQGLCKPCHSRKTARDNAGNAKRNQALPNWIRRPAIPGTIVCGGPGSGKSHYVSHHKKENDIVIDLDMITAELSGLPIYQADAAKWLSPAMAERNRRLDALATATGGRYWFIVGMPTHREQIFWTNKLTGANVITHKVSQDQCLTRIASDPRRRCCIGRHRAACEQWFASVRDDANKKNIFKLK